MNLLELNQLPKNYKFFALPNELKFEVTLLLTTNYIFKELYLFVL